MPLISHPKVPDVDPDVSPYLSTWNFEWTPEQIDATVGLAKANFADGADRLKRTVRAVYLRKKKERLRREQEAKEREVERLEEIRARGEMGVGDQFS